MSLADTIRALFALHRHLLEHILGPLSESGNLTSEWFKKSHDTLDTVTKIFADSVNSHESLAAHLIDVLPPSCIYIIRAVLDHIRESPGLKKSLESEGIYKRLQTSLNQLSHRWGLISHELWYEIRNTTMTHP